MKPRELFDLLLLAALWGGSFLFIRIAAPEFGPLPLAFLRVTLAALVLLPLLLLRGQLGQLGQQPGSMLVLGMANSGLPFALFGFAALSLPVALSSIFNAVTPMATALLAWLWLGQRLSGLRSLGMLIGLAGVAGLAVAKSLRPGAVAGAPIQFETGTLAGIGACLLATLLYGFAANFAKQRMRGFSPLAMTAGSQASAALGLALPALLTWPATLPSVRAWVALIGLAVLCTSLAYLLYFRLLARVSSTTASSVTFLIPVFAMAWGWLGLGEAVTGAMLLGGAVILIGTALAMGLLPRPRNPA